MDDLLTPTGGHLPDFFCQPEVRNKLSSCSSLDHVPIRFGLIKLSATPETFKLLSTKHQLNSRECSLYFSQSSSELNQLEGLQDHNEIILRSGCQHVFCERSHPDGGWVVMQKRLCSLLAR
jgi:hypothetical protein